MLRHDLSKQKYKKHFRILTNRRFPLGESSACYYSKSSSRKKYSRELAYWRFVCAKGGYSTRLNEQWHHSIIFISQWYGGWYIFTAWKREVITRGGRSVRTRVHTYLFVKASRLRNRYIITEGWTRHVLAIVPASQLIRSWNNPRCTN